ncbi:hypothetical protein [Nocardia spumae]|uniref:hypothetical protein n=1 Tax=Nocardia spumae TaxID=2887190 RepID=UPI001D13AD28|nr:hypothetical protein [Nocardia spumae]
MPLLTIRLRADATLAAARSQLHLADDEVDHDFGLVAVDPAQDLYALRVTDTAADRIAAAASGTAEVFADPRITPAADSGSAPPDDAVGGPLR